MSEKKVKPKKKMSRSAKVLIAGIVIIMIPVLVFAYILISASLETGRPVTGDRFKGDLEPAISSETIKALEDRIGALVDVEKCEITLVTAQLRVNVDTKDSISKEEAEALVDSIYDIVNKELPMGTYFTASGNKKMYDLAINVYNFIDADSDAMIYYLLTKNSQMSSPTVQLVSEPVDEDLAASLRGELDIDIDDNIDDDNE